MNPVLLAALEAFEEAVQCMQQQNVPRVHELLYSEGDYLTAMRSEQLSPTTRTWLLDLRDTLCRHIR